MLNSSLHSIRSKTICITVDEPLIVQFAANNALDFANATELVANNCIGTDLNCGCPQKWAMAEGYGACLINNPQLLRDVVLQTRNRIPNNDFSVSIKIRIHPDIRLTLKHSYIKIQFKCYNLILIAGRL